MHTLCNSRPAGRREQHVAVNASNFRGPVDKPARQCGSQTRPRHHVRQEQGGTRNEVVILEGAAQV